MITIEKEFHFCAGHRLLHHEGGCAHIHGHNYKATVRCEGQLDPIGRVIDFGDVKQKLGAWIDANWDHAFLVNHDDPFCQYLIQNGNRMWVMDRNPTAENMAQELYFIAKHVLPVKVVSITIQETPTSCATFEVGDF